MQTSLYYRQVYNNIAQILIYVNTHDLNLLIKLGRSYAVEVVRARTPYFSEFYSPNCVSPIGFTFCVFSLYQTMVRIKIALRFWRAMVQTYFMKMFQMIKL
jgi:hypothetical protein